MAIFNVSKTFAQSIMAGLAVIVGFFAILFTTTHQFSNLSTGDVLGGVVHADAASCSCTDAGCNCSCGDCGCGGCDGCGCAS